MLAAQAGKEGKCALGEHTAKLAQLHESSVKAEKASLPAEDAVTVAAGNASPASAVLY